MKAMIFAAGLGTRLKPITDTLPKALVPVKGKPLLQHVMTKLSGLKDQNGDPLIDGFVVNVHHFSDKILAWLDGREVQSWEPSKVLEKKAGIDLPVAVSDESALLLETGGAVLHARPHLDGCGSFLIHNVDIFSNADISWFASQVREESLATLMVSKRETSRFLLFRPEDMTLVGWYNNGTGDYHLTDPAMKIEDCLSFGFSGIHVMSDRVFDLMEEYIKEKGLPTDEVNGTRFPIMNFYMWASTRQPIHGVVADNLEFLDVGKLDTLDRAEEFLASL
jgi:NDP-sugar pyrophosphorylase family protein